ncbi:MAG: DUF721 domain-containing protein [bacterium]
MSEEERNPAARPLHIGAILEDLMRDPLMQERSRAFEALALWEEVAGREIAKHCRAAAIQSDRGTMIVDVEHAVWMHQLQMQEEALRDLLNERIGRKLIRKIRFRLGPAV